MIAKTNQTKMKAGSKRKGEFRGSQEETVVDQKSHKRRK
jgi:hypothetical protein